MFHGSLKKFYKTNVLKYYLAYLSLDIYVSKDLPMYVVKILAGDDQRSEIRNQRSETTDQGLEVKNHRSQIRN